MKSLLVPLLAATLGIGTLVGTANAGPVSDHAIEAEKSLNKGNTDAALKAWDAAAEAFWAAAPMTVHNAQLVENATGFGVYTPRKSNIFAPGETLVIYAEPKGFGYGDDGLGNQLIGLTIDVTIKQPTGRELLRQPDIAQIRVGSRTRNRELFAQIDLSVDGAPVGKYVATVTVRDMNSDKKANFDIAFEIAK